MIVTLYHVERVSQTEWAATWVVQSEGNDDRVLLFNGDSTSIMWGHHGPVTHREPVRPDVAQRMAHLIHLGISPTDSGDPEMFPQGVRVVNDQEFASFIGAPLINNIGNA